MEVGEKSNYERSVCVCVCVSACVHVRMML